MNKWVRRSLSAGALTASALLVGGAAAHASPLTSTGNIGALNGTQAALPIQAPINVCGIAAAVGGHAAAGCDGGAAAAIDEWTYASSMVSANNTGVGNGTQVHAPIQVPVNVCGVAVGVLGTAQAGCEGGSDAGGDRPDDRDSGDNGYGYDQPGDDQYGYDYDPGMFAPAESTGGTESLLSSGNVGLLNGTQVVAPVQLPINICGVAVAALGTAQAGCEGGASADL